MKNESSNGLAHACLLDGSGGYSLLEIRELDRWKPEDGALWLHFDLEEGEAQKWIREQSGIPEIAVEALLEVESRPRLTVVGEAALLAFRGVNCNPGATPDDMIGLRIWFEKDRVISSYRRKLHSVDDVLAELQSGGGSKTAPEVIVSLAACLVQRMSETISNLGDLIDDLEEQLIEDRAQNARFALSDMRRQIIALRRYMAPQREALAGLSSSRFPWMTEEYRLSLRETNDHLIRHLEDLDAIRERAAVTQEELQNRLAERQNVRMYVLSIVTAIFLPLGFLTGLLGINVGGIPGANNSAAFGWFATFLGLIVVIEVILFRFRKWF